MTETDHPLPFDLDDDADRQRASATFDKWITDDEVAQTNYFKEWDNVDLRLTTAFQPVGWSTDVIEELRQMNDPTVRADQLKQNKIFVSVNRSRPNHEAGLGDYLSVQRKLSVTAHNPQDRNRARVFKRILEYIEKKYMMPMLIYFPLMDNAWSKGLHWVKMNWNPAKAALKGMFEPQEISCRDVLVDNQARGVFFSSARRFTHRFKLDKDDANRMFRHYRHFVVDGFGTDNEYDNAWQNNKDAKQQDEQATFYYIEFRKTIGRYYFANPKNAGSDQEVEEISAEMYDELLRDEQLSPLVFEEEEEAYYIALYNKKLGCFDLKYNPFGQWLLTPLVNVEASNRLYPMGDIQIYANLSDLLDVLVTVFLQNAKKLNKPVYGGSPEVWEEHQDQINSAIAQGGFAPGIDNQFSVSPVNAYLTQLIPMTMGWIQDTVSKHSATMGELPAKQIAKETVQALMAKDRVAQGRKDVCLNYCLTQVERLIVKMVAKFYRDADYIAVTDMRPGREGYIPLNQEWTEEEYLAAIAQMYGLNVPQQPDMNRIPEANQEQAQNQYEEQALQFEQQMLQLRRKFENENQVDEVPTKAVELAQMKDDKLTMHDIIPLDRLPQYIKESGLQPEQFVEAYNARPTMMTMYKVNTIDEDLDLSIFYEINNDFQDDPQFKMNMAFKEREMGMLSGEDFYKEIGDVNGAEKWKNAQEENQYIQLAKQIASDPVMYQQVMAVVSGMAKAVPTNGQEKTNG